MNKICEILLFCFSWQAFLDCVFMGLIVRYYFSDSHYSTQVPSRFLLECNEEYDVPHKNILNWTMDISLETEVLSSNMLFFAFSFSLGTQLPVQCLWILLLTCRRLPHSQNLATWTWTIDIEFHPLKTSHKFIHFCQMNISVCFHCDGHTFNIPQVPQLVSFTRHVCVCFGIQDPCVSWYIKT